MSRFPGFKGHEKWRPDPSDFPYAEVKKSSILQQEILDADSVEKLEDIVARVNAHSDSVSPSSQATLAHRCGKLVRDRRCTAHRLRESEEITAFFEKMAFNDIFKAREVSNVIWALGVLLENAENCTKIYSLSRCLKSTLLHMKLRGNIDWNIRDIANLIWAVAILTKAYDTQSNKPEITKSEHDGEVDPLELNLLWNVAVESCNISFNLMGTNSKSYSPSNGVERSLANIIWGLTVIMSKGEHQCGADSMVDCIEIMVSFCIDNLGFLNWQDICNISYALGLLANSKHCKGFEGIVCPLIEDWFSSLLLDRLKQISAYADCIGSANFLWGIASCKSKRMLQSDPQGIVSYLAAAKCWGRRGHIRHVASFIYSCATADQILTFPQTFLSVRSYDAPFEDLQHKDLTRLLCSSTFWRDAAMTQVTRNVCRHLTTSSAETVFVSFKPADFILWAKCLANRFFNPLKYRIR